MKNKLSLKEVEIVLGLLTSKRMDGWLTKDEKELFKRLNEFSIDRNNE